MNVKALRGMGNVELKAKLAELRLELMQENSQIAIGTVPKSPGKLRSLKRTIARIHTLLGQQLEAAKKI